MNVNIRTRLFFALVLLGACHRLLAMEPQVDRILFLIADDLRASVVSCYGDPICKTPNIDRLAESGMLFRNAYCQATWCAPSRQSQP